MARIPNLKTKRLVVDELVNSAGTSLATATLSTDGTMAGNSDTETPSEKAVKTYVDNSVAADTQSGKVLNPDGLLIVAEELTESGAIGTGSYIELNHETVAVEATITLPTAGRFLVITQTDSGTAGHTVTLADGTFDGTNEIATFDAQGETLVLFGVSGTRFVIVENIGSVGLSTAGG